MAYMKHPERGNKHVPDADVEQLQAEGWVRWPRPKEQKAGVVPEPVKAVAPEAVEPEVRTKRKYTRKA